MKVVNSEVGEGDTPVVNSRYSIVLATAKRARQIIARQSKDDLNVIKVSKPLSKAVRELNEGKLKILAETEETEDEVLVAEELQEQAEAPAPEETSVQEEPQEQE